MSEFTPDQIQSYMNIAINLGLQNLGQTMPNPSVGAIIVQNLNGKFKIVGQGVTSSSGRPHAEVNAFAQAGNLAKGAALFVSLEPCSHYGKSPPCVDAIIAAGISTVFAACEDPNPHVFGQGFDKLRNAGIKICMPVLENNAMWSHAGHIIRIIHKRPFTQLKLSFSSEGCLAEAGKVPVQISNSFSMAHVHRIRSMVDAVMIGSETAIMDNPQLTVRLNGYNKPQPTRIVIDSQLRLQIDSHLVTQARSVRTIILTSMRANKEKSEILTENGLEVIEIPTIGHNINLHVGFEHLATLGFTRILLEGGATLAQKCLLENLVDEVLISSTNTVLPLGGYMPGLQKALEKQILAQGFVVKDSYELDKDKWHIWRKENHPCLPA